MSDQRAQRDKGVDVGRRTRVQRPNARRASKGVRRTGDIGLWPKKQFAHVATLLRIAAYEPLKDWPPTTWFAPGSLQEALINRPDADAWKIVIQQRADETWAELESDPVYRSLLRDPNFGEAWRLFQKAQRRSSGPRLKDPHADFKFLFGVLMFLGMGDSYFSKASQQLNGKQRASALRHIKALQKLVQAGGLDSRMWSAKEPLISLKNAVTDVSRSARKNEHSIPRSFAQTLAHWLQPQLGPISAGIITELAQMAGHEVNRRVVERWIR